MKKTVAIVAPSPVPFVVGGIENLAQSLGEYLNRQGIRHAEVIKVPSPEGDFGSLLDSYERFSKLKLDHFDSVISIKYPAWMLQHHNHLVYMTHRLRGLYDTYHFSGQPTDLPRHAPLEIQELWQLVSRDDIGRSALAEVFERSRGVLSAGCDAAWTALPSPLVRAVIHRLDAIGMQGVRRFFAISRTVAERAGYFPPGQHVDVAVPPSGLKPVEPRRQEYLFTVSRLDAPKRINLLIEAMRLINGDIRLIVAGTGPQLAALESLAGGDPRIEFVGYVGESQLAAYYADALAVAFVPYDEDLGLITLEAMSCGKPVITTSDAGGPTEFVENGVTGWVSEPSAEHLATAMQQAIDDPGRSAAMGLEARRRTEASVSWERVASAITGEKPTAKQVADASTLAVRRRRIVVLSTFQVYPPMGGGQARIFHLWRRVARTHDVTILALAPTGSGADDKMIAPGMRQIVVPITAAQQEHERNISGRLGWHPASDVAFAMAPELTPAFRGWFKELAPDTDLVVASHPYAAAAIRDLALPEVWYEAHNHEGPMKRGMYGEVKGAAVAVSCIDELERWLCERASTVLVVSEADRSTLTAQHDVEDAKFVLAPNGVDLDSVRFRCNAVRTGLQHGLGLSRPMGVMLASWHGPNLEAVESLLEAASALTDVDFCVIGSAAGAFKDRKLPRNVHMLGMVSDAEKDVLLGAASIALNPMQSGGGSNLKLLDYMAAGVPVVTSAFGARGTAITDDEAWIYERDELIQAVKDAISADRALVERRTRNARETVDKFYSWDVIATKLSIRLGQPQQD